MILEAQEIFSDGRHNGIDFPDGSSAAMATAAKALALDGRIPLKLSHEGPDERFDPLTKFALGWAKNIREAGGKLLADFDVPEKVGELIKQGFLKFVSVELLKDVQAGTRVIPWVLDAIALLGSEQPAIGTLRELTALKASDHVFRERVVFTRGDRKTMTDTDSLKAELAKARQKAIAVIFDSAITAGRILPRDRQAFVQRFGEAGTPEQAESWIAETPRPANFRRAASLGVQTDRELSDNVEADLSRAVEQEQLQHRQQRGIDLSAHEAALRIFRRDPEFAKRWRTAPGESA